MIEKLCTVEMIPHFVDQRFGRPYLAYMERVTYLFGLFPIRRERIYDN